MKDPGQPHINAVQWVLKQLRKYGFYTNLKKYQFYKDKIQFLGFVVLAKGIRIGEKKINALRDWLEPQSIRDI